MRALGVAILTLAAVRGGAGQVETSFSGYVLTLPALLSLSPAAADSAGLSRHQVMDVTRIRLRPSLSLPWNALLEVEYEVAGIVQSTDQPVMIEREEIGRQVTPLRWSISHSARYSLIHFIDRLVYRQRFEAGELAVGRQRISWGTGRVWNPTDLFNPINPVNFAKVEKDGADAVSAKVNLGTLSDLQIVWNPVRRGAPNYGTRLRTHAGEYDFSILGGYFDGSSVAGGDLAGNLGPLGLRGEILWSGAGPKHPAAYVKYIAGVDDQVTAQLYALVEYQFNGQGSENPSAYDVDALYRGETLNLARHYLAVSASYLIHPLVTLTATGTANFDDGSQFYAGTASCSATDNLVVELGLYGLVADPGDEFSFYPGAAYVKLEYYF
jgi:hypothetical protein